MGSSMLIGFNNDVEYKGRMFHIQTEDHGIKDGHITTILFFSGQILDSKKISYQDDIKGISNIEERKKTIKKRMVELHREFYKKLFDGTYQDKVDELASKEEPEAAKGPSSKPSAKAAPKSASKPPPRPQTGTAKKIGLTRPAAAPTAAPKPAARPKPPPLKLAVKAKIEQPPAPMPVKHPAYRGIEWPDKDLRLDGLVAEFLGSR